MTSEKSAPSAAAGTAEKSADRAAAPIRTFPPVPAPPHGDADADGNGSSSTVDVARSASSESVVDETTHRREPVETAASPAAEAAIAPSSTAKAGVVSPTTEAVDEDESSERAQGVKAGAVKAAAAALAAAKSAAKKVQAAIPDADPGAAPTARSQNGADTRPAPSAAPRPEMHYQAGGIRGTATPVGNPASGAAAGTATGATPVVQDAGPRRVRLSVSRIDPWSIMKLAFLLAVAIAIMTVVATAVVWYVLNNLGVFATIEDFIRNTVGAETQVNITQFVELDRMLSLSTLIALVNVVLLTAVATIMAILYNITAALVGGVHLTLTDE